MCSLVVSVKNLYDTLSAIIKIDYQLHDFVVDTKEENLLKPILMQNGKNIAGALLKCLLKKALTGIKVMSRALFEIDEQEDDNRETNMAGSVG